MVLMGDKTRYGWLGQLAVTAPVLSHILTYLALSSPLILAYFALRHVWASLATSSLEPVAMVDAYNRAFLALFPAAYAVFDAALMAWLLRGCDPSSRRDRRRAAAVASRNIHVVYPVATLLSIVFLYEPPISLMAKYGRLMTIALRREQYSRANMYTSLHNRISDSVLPTLMLAILAAWGISIAVSIIVYLARCGLDDP